MTILLIGALILLVVSQWRPSLRDQVEEFMADEGIKGGVVVTMRGGTIENWFSTGHDRTLESPPLRKDARFPFASLTKVITAATVRKLVATGKLRIDSRLTDIVRIGPAADARFKEVTIGQLLEHTSGLPGTDRSDPMFDELGHALGCDGAMVASLRHPLRTPPGQETRYSNVGYCFLEAVIAKIAGRSYAEEAMQSVLIPASASGITMGPRDDTEAATWGTRRGAEEWRRLGPVGGWFGDAKSMLSFVRADMVDPAIISRSIDPSSPPHYCLGWHITPTKESFDLTHTGVLPELFTFALARPDGFFAVALFNGPVRNRDLARDRLRQILR